MRADNRPLANHHRERGRSQLELLAEGYLKYTLVDNSGRPLAL